MGGNKVTPKARALGNALRDARAVRNLDQRALANLVGIHHSALSRYETGQRRPATETVSAILAVLGVNGVERDQIIDLARDNGSPWLAIRLPEQRRQLAALLDMERNATRITDASAVMVPGLLQTDRYIRAVMSEGGVPPHEIEMRTHVRIGRRAAVSRAENPVHVLALMGEAAIHQMIGGREVMIEQLRHLVQVADLPNVELRVLPFSSGWHPVMEGLFLLIESEEEPPVVHLENRRSGLFLHEMPDVETYQHATEKALQAALSPEASVRLIAGQMNRMQNNDT